MTCGLRSAVFHDLHGLHIHETRKHKKVDGISMQTTSNQCVWCDFVFAQRRGLRDEVVWRQQHGRCPRTHKRCCTCFIAPKRCLVHDACITSKIGMTCGNIFADLRNVLLVRCACLFSEFGCVLNQSTRLLLAA